MPYIKFLTAFFVIASLYAQSVLHIRSGTESNLPTTCVAGDWYYATDSTPGLNVFYCTSTDVWTRSSSLPPSDTTTGYQPNQILSGGGVEYTSGLTFNIG